MAKAKKQKIVKAEIITARRHKRLIFNRSSYLFRTVPETGKPVLRKIGRDETALLIDIAVKEEDNLPVWVYADWLEEHGFVLAALDIRHRLGMAVREAEIRAGKKKRKPSRAELLWREYDKLMSISHSRRTPEQNARIQELRSDCCIDCGQAFPGPRHVCRLEDINEAHYPMTDEEIEADNKEYEKRWQKMVEEKMFETP